MYAIIETPQLSDGDETRRIRLRPCFTGRYFAADETQQTDSAKRRRVRTDNREPHSPAETRDPLPDTQTGAHP